MKIPELAEACTAALRKGIDVTLTFPKGKKGMKGFPRGELLCENPNTGERTYAFKPLKLLLSMQRAGVIRIQLTDNGKPI